MRLTDDQFAAFLRRVYAHASRNSGWWGDDVEYPQDWNTDDRVTFGNWRLGLEEWLDTLEAKIQVKE